MVSALKKTEIQTVKEMVDMFKNTVNQSKAELDVIDEKYRKLIEEEKKSLKSQLAEATKQLKVWEKLFSSFDSTMVQEALGYEATATVEEADEPKVETNATVEEAEPIITDTIFPENNESEDTTEPAPVAEDAGEPVGDPVPDEPAPAPKNLDEEEDADWNQRIESGELKPVDWPEEQPAEKKEVPVLVDGDEGWPVPEEWK